MQCGAQGSDFNLRHPRIWGVRARNGAKSTLDSVRTAHTPACIATVVAADGCWDAKVYTQAGGYNQRGAWYRTTCGKEKTCQQARRLITRGAPNGDAISEGVAGARRWRQGRQQRQDARVSAQ